MAQGDKTKYTNKQKRQAEHIEEGYEEKGLSEKEAEKRAWATVNKIYGGGEKRGGGGYGKPVNASVYKKAGKKGGNKQKKHNRSQYKKGGRAGGKGGKRQGGRKAR